MNAWLRWSAVIMVAAAAAGTALFLLAERAQGRAPTAVGWSVLVVVWFVVLRRLWYLRRGSGRNQS